MLTVAGAIALTSCGSMAGLSGYYYDDVYFNPKTDTVLLEQRTNTNHYAKTNNYKIVNDLHKTFYGTSEFAVQDPDGYICVFASK